MTSTTSLVPTAEPEPSLIKSDVLGRTRRTREQRERMLDEYEHSGLSGPKSAALCGVKYQTFGTGLQRRKGQRNKYSKRQPQGRGRNRSRPRCQFAGKTSQGFAGENRPLLR